jgi:hypothetical protein
VLHVSSLAAAQSFPVFLFCSSEHAGLLGIAIPGLLLYGLAFLATLCWLFYRHRKLTE